MPLLIDKFLTIFAMPLGSALAVCLALLTIFRPRFPKLSCAATIVILCTLWIASTPQGARFALQTLEQQHPMQLPRDIPTADVAIVLGGGIEPPNAHNRLPDLNDASDRLLHAARLWKRGKVKYILLSGGRASWDSSRTSEAVAMKRVLALFGIDGGALLIEGKSRTTYENAVFSKLLWKRHKFSSGLLVTSAYHMPRALRVFRKQGFNVRPVTTDIRRGRFETAPALAFIPDVKALLAVTLVVKEWIGLFVYHWRGWI